MAATATVTTKTAKTTATTPPKVVSVTIEGGGKSFLGTVNGDVISGTSFADIMFGDAGNDTLLGKDGNDTIDGGDGRDYIDAGNGNDIVSDGAGDDTSVRLGRGNDTYLGSAGSDNVSSDVGPTKGVIEFDTADYSGFATATVFDINRDDAKVLTITSAGVLETDKLSRFDSYIGTALNDVFLMTGAPATLPEVGPDHFTVTGGAGSDTFVVAKFVQSEVRVVVTSTGADEIQLVGSAPVVTDFAPGVDKIGFDVESFAELPDEANDPAFVFSVGTVIETEFGNFVVEALDEAGDPIIVFEPEAISFQNVARDADGALVDAQEGNNVYVLQGSFESAEAAADALALALSSGEIDDGAGFGVYFDSSTQSIRTFSTDDLDNLDAVVTVIGNFENDLGAEANIDLLATLDAADFSLVNSEVFFG
jgi:hypothetical protein